MPFFLYSKIFYVFSEEVIACKSAGVPTRRNTIQLFQFKYYNQQEPLGLTKDEMDEVVKSVVNPPEGNYETRLIGSKILIKVCKNIYLNHNY